VPREEDLVPGESILLRVTRHPIVLVERSWKAVALALIVVVVAMILKLQGSASDLRWFLTLAVLLLSLIYIDLQWIIWRSETFTITNERVILRRGVIGRFSRSIATDRVQDITTSQGVIGRMFGYGTVEVESAGKDSAEELRYVPDPNRFRNLLFEQVRPGQAPPAAR
jgi:uncharacterized membrane protein YdbT with pleckstrin-like domain